MILLEAIGEDQYHIGLLLNNDLKNVKSFTEPINNNKVSLSAKQQVSIILKDIRIKSQHYKEWLYVARSLFRLCFLR